MGAFFVYILKSSFCLVLFYLFYRLLMSKETFHRFNRCALMGTLLLVALLPLAQAGIAHSDGVLQSVLMPENQMQMSLPADGMSAEVVAEAPSVGWAQVLLLVYLSGLVGCLCYQVFSFVRLAGVFHKARREPLARYLSGCQDTGVRLLVSDGRVSPFSWMRYVVVSRKDLQENGREILLHELAHIRHRHSWDLLLADVCILFQWFNPAAWLLKQELQTIHEYEADDTVLACGVNAKEYQMLLIKKAVGARLYSIANNLNHSSLKKRITMMIKKKSSPWARVKCLYVLPLAAVAVAAFARPEISKELDEISSVKVNDLTSIVKAEEVKSAEKSSVAKIKVSGKVLDAQTKIPVIGASVVIKGTKIGTLTDFDGKFSLQAGKGQVILIAFAGYQTQAVKVPEDGKPLVILLKDASKQLEEIDVIGLANTEQVAQTKTFHQVSLKVDRGAADEDVTLVKGYLRAWNKDGWAIRTESERNPLMVVNGEVREDIGYQDIPVEYVQMVSVLKAESAVAQYGEKAKDGAIVITLMKDKKI